MDKKEHSLGEKISTLVFALTTLVLLATAVFYMIADFGRGRTRLYGFVLLFLCLIFCITKFTTGHSFPFLLAAAAIQVPAIALYAMNVSSHFNWQGVPHGLDVERMAGVHTAFLVLCLLLACTGYRGWKVFAAEMKRETEEEKK